MKKTESHRFGGFLIGCIPDMAVFAILVLLGIVYTFELDSILDIGLSDESNYLHRGMMIPLEFPSAQESSGYSIWYRVLALVQPETIRLYFLNYKLMTILPPLALFLTLRVFRVSRLVALAVSAVFLFSTSNIPTWPKISHFAALVLLSGFLLSGLTRKRTLQTGILTVTALVTSSIRPEFFLAYIVLSVLLLVQTLRAYRRIQSCRAFIPLLITLVLFFGLALWMGVPVSGGDRGMIAFGQHYALDWVKRTGASFNPWTTWEMVIEKDFGDVHSPLQALLSNPSAFLRHVAGNLSAFPGKVLKLFLSSYPRCTRAYPVLKLGVAVLALAGLPVVFSGRLRASMHFLRENLRASWFHLILLGILLLPVIISIVLIHPRLHYVYLFGLLSMLGTVIVLFRNPGSDNKGSTWLLTALISAASLILVHPAADAVSAHPQPVLKTILFLRQLDLTEPVYVLGGGGGLEQYVGRSYSRVTPWDKNQPFLDFLSARSINMIIGSSQLSQDLRFRDDPQWKTFLQDPPAFGFVQLEVPDVSHASILVSRALLEKD